MYLSNYDFICFSHWNIFVLHQENTLFCCQNRIPLGFCFLQHKIKVLFFFLSLHGLASDRIFKRNRNSRASKSYTVYINTKHFRLVIVQNREKSAASYLTVIITVHFEGTTLVFDIHWSFCQKSWLWKREKLWENFHQEKLGVVDKARPKKRRKKKKDALLSCLCMNQVHVNK